MAESILNALLFKEKYKLPPLEPLDLGESQREAIGSNLSSFEQISKLGRKANKFLAEEISKAAERILPGYGKLLSGVTGALQSGVEGNLPEGVARNLRRYAAELGVGTGTVGSQFSAFRAVDLYGRETNEYVQRTINSAMAWLDKARSTTPMFDIRSSFITPAQQFAADQYNQQTQFQYQLHKNILAAQPEPWEQAVGGLMDWIATTSLNTAGAYVGGGMGTGGQAGQPVGGGGGGYSGSGMSGLQGQEQGMFGGIFG